MRRDDHFRGYVINHELGKICDGFVVSRSDNGKEWMEVDVIYQSGIA